MAALFFDRYQDILAYIMEYISMSELENVAVVSRGMAAGTKLRRDKIRKFEFQGRGFGEVNEVFTRTIPELRVELLTAVDNAVRYTLFQSIKPASYLRRLDLVMCRMVYSDFRETLMHLRHTLRDLRIEMICLFKSDPAEAFRNGQTPVLIDEPGQDEAESHTQSTTTSGSGMVEEPIVMEALRRLDLSPPSSSVFRGVLFPNLTRLSSYRKMLDDKCSKCGTARPSSKCGACKFYAFCARQCQMENWVDTSLGHRRVCHVSPEADSPVAVSRLILSAARSGQLRELDLAHYWHQNVLFSGSFPSASAVSDDVEDDPDDPEKNPDGTAVAVFSRGVAIRVFERLSSLRLLRCGLEDHALKVIGSHAYQLKCLDISLNTKITDRGLRHLTPMAKVLKDLRLRQNYRLTDSGVREALVELTSLERIDLRFGIKRLRSRAPIEGLDQAVNLIAVPNALFGDAQANGEQAHDHSEQQQLHQQRQIRITATTSRETLVALFEACPNLSYVRIIATEEGGNVATKVPREFEGKVDCDSQGGIEVDEWGEPDDFYEGWTDFAEQDLS